MTLLISLSTDDDYEFTPEAALDVDNLVSDPLDDVQTSVLDPLSRFGTPQTPSVPPGLGFSVHGHPSRTGTPSRPPPGLPIPPSATISPAIPLTGGAPVTPLKPALTAAVPLQSESSKASKKTPAAGSEAKKNIKALALESGLSKEITSQSKGAPKNKKTLLQDEDFPALESAKPAGLSRTSTPNPIRVPSIKTPMVVKKAQQIETPKPAPATPAPAETPVESPSVQQKSKKLEKKPMPALNIAAATAATKAIAAKKSNPSSAVTSAVEKPDDTAFPALPTPSSISVASPATRAPKTIRVISTPKTETPPLFAGAANVPPPLRNTLSDLRRPETPVSENVSDSASIISASISASRTNSPPPTSSRVGSAAVRSTTKSQQRKARKEAGKKDTVAIVTAPKPEPEIEIAPILGRKKKQKKEKPSVSKETTPAIDSQPASPAPAETPAEKGPEKAPEKVEKPIEKESKVQNPEKVSTYRQTVNESIALDEPLTLRSRRKEGNVAQAEGSKPALDRPIPTPAAVLKELVNSGLISDPEALALMKAISATSHRSDQHTPALPKDGVIADLKALITAEDQQALLAGQPVHKVVDGSRVMLTPNGNCVRNLSAAEEERYLLLQAELAAKFEDATAYVHPRHEAAGGYSVIKGRVVGNGAPPYFPQTAAPASSNDEELLLPVVNDPTLKMTREEALANINQTILTRFNLGTMNLSSLIEGHHGGAVGGNMEGSPMPSAEADAASKNVIKTLEPLFSTLASNAHSHPLDGTAIGSETFSGLAQTMPPPPPLPSTSAAAIAAGKTMAASVAKGGALAGITSMSLEDMEQAFALAKREAEKVEKSLNQVIKKNRRLLSLSASGAGGGH